MGGRGLAGWAPWGALVGGFGLGRAARPTPSLLPGLSTLFGRCRRWAVPFTAPRWFLPLRHKHRSWCAPREGSLGMPGSGQIEERNVTSPDALTPWRGIVGGKRWLPQGFLLSDRTFHAGSWGLSGNEDAWEEETRGCARHGCQEVSDECRVM